MFAEKGHDNTNWRVAELNTLLGWYKIPNLTKMSKQEKMMKWNNTHSGNVKPPEYNKLSDSDEIALLEASKTDNGIGDTAVGRLDMKWKIEFKQVARKMTDEEWTEIEAIWNLKRREASNATSPGINGIDGDEGAI